MLKRRNNNIHIVSNMHFSRRNNIILNLHFILNSDFMHSLVFCSPRIRWQWHNRGKGGRFITSSWGVVVQSIISHIMHCKPTFEYTRSMVSHHGWHNREECIVPLSGMQVKAQQWHTQQACAVRGHAQNRSVWCDISQEWVTPLMTQTTTGGAYCKMHR